MNWVWTQSPTSGNERLVLLALADACSRDDGGGCWPSAATIARKAGISERTVRRVTARLEAGGHVLVHRGGGRDSNSYTVVMDIHSPGQNVTPDNLTGVTPGVTAGVTQPRQGSPDTAVSPDPSLIHHGTAAARAREADRSPGTGKRSAAGGNPAKRTRRPSPTSPRPVDEPETGQFFAALGDAWPLSGAQRDRLAPAVRAAIAAGWPPGDLAALVGANSTGIRSPYAILTSRLSPAELPVPPAPVPRRRQWCGRCDEVTRLELDEFGYPDTRRCPDCGTPAQPPGTIPPETGGSKPHDSEKGRPDDRQGPNSQPRPMRSPRGSHDHQAAGEGSRRPVR